MGKQCPLQTALMVDMTIFIQIVRIFPHCFCISPNQSLLQQRKLHSSTSPFQTWARWNRIRWVLSKADGNIMELYKFRQVRSSLTQIYNLCKVAFSHTKPQQKARKGLHKKGQAYQDGIGVSMQSDSSAQTAASGSRSCCQHPSTWYRPTQRT